MNLNNLYAMLLRLVQRVNLLFGRVRVLEQNQEGGGSGGGTTPTLGEILAVENGNITNGYALRLDDNNEPYLQNALGNYQLESDANNGLRINDAAGNQVFNANDKQFTQSIEFIEANLIMNASNIIFNDGQIEIAGNGRTTVISDYSIALNSADGSNFNQLIAGNITEARIASLQDRDGTLAYVDCKSYVCQVFQNGTNNAYDNVLGTPTIGGFLQWTRIDTGIYNGVLAGAFPDQNRIRFVYSGFTKDSSFIKVYRIDDSTIQIEQVDLELNPIDGITEPFDLEIQVYETNQFND